MDVMRGTLAIVVTLLLGAAGSLIASETYVRCETFARQLLRAALSMLPPDKKDRYEEEWFSHLNECRGNIHKLLHAFGCFYCAVFRSKYLNLSDAYALRDSEEKGELVVNIPKVVVPAARLVPNEEPGPVIAYRTTTDTNLFYSVCVERPALLNVVDSKTILGQRFTGMNDWFEKRYYEISHEE